MCGAKGEAVKKAVYRRLGGWGKKRTSVVAQLTFRINEDGENDGDD
jgi:hypothetical protein